jgi:hypothetical protein
MSIIHNKMVDPDDNSYIVDLVKLKKYMSNDFTNSEFAPNYNEFGLKMHNFTDQDVFVDKNHKYITNSNGFRTKELQDTDFIFAGCSQTFGIGIQEEAIWGNRVAEYFNYSSINLSEPGAGVDRIINYIFSYLKKYSAPKMIICLFPDFGRMLYPIVTPLVTYENYNLKTREHLQMHNIYLGNHNDFDRRPKFDKKPYTVEHTVPYELPFFKSINQIMILDQYCKSHNIQFYWGTWDCELNKTITKYNEINNIYDNFVSMDVSSWVVDNMGQEKFILNEKDFSLPFSKIKDFCHDEIKHKFEDTFYRGSDIEIISDYSKNKPHVGSHKHAHFADSFINFINKIKI